MPRIRPPGIGGAGGYLINSVEECAEKTLRLLRDPAEGMELARRGKETVRENFLLTRLIEDEISLYASLLGAPEKPRLLGKETER